MAALAENDSMEGLDITAEDLEAMAAEGDLDAYLSDEGGDEDFDFEAREQAMQEVEKEIVDFSNVIFVDKLPKAPASKEKKLCAVSLLVGGLCGMRAQNLTTPRRSPPAPPLPATPHTGPRLCQDLWQVRQVAQVQLGDRHLHAAHGRRQADVRNCVYQVRGCG